MDFQSLIERKRERFQQLESEIADPRLFDNRKRASEIMREHAAIRELLAKWEQLEVVRRQLADNRELATSDELDLAQIAQEEIPALEKRVASLEFDLQVALLPPDASEERDAIVEIRAGTGGSEAAIFAADECTDYDLIQIGQDDADAVWKSQAQDNMGAYIDAQVGGAIGAGDRLHLIERAKGETDAYIGDHGCDDPQVLELLSVFDTELEPLLPPR